MPGQFSILSHILSGISIKFQSLFPIFHAILLPLERERECGDFCDCGGYLENHGEREREDFHLSNFYRGEENFKILIHLYGVD